MLSLGQSGPEPVLVPCWSRAGPWDGRGAVSPGPYPVCMPSLSKFLADNRGLSEKEADWLQHLIGDWNLLSDLLRADLVLWIQEEAGALAVAHCRPATGSTVYYEDPVGSPSDDGEEGTEITRLLAGASRTTAPLRSNVRDALPPVCWSRSARTGARSPCWRRRTRPTTA